MCLVSFWIDIEQIFEQETLWRNGYNSKSCYPEVVGSIPASGNFFFQISFGPNMAFLRCFSKWFEIFYPRKAFLMFIMKINSWNCFIGFHNQKAAKFLFFQ